MCYFQFYYSAYFAVALVAQRSAPPLLFEPLPSFNQTSTALGLKYFFQVLSETAKDILVIIKHDVMYTYEK
jgi:hypothetical protein